MQIVDAKLKYAKALAPRKLSDIGIIIIHHAAAQKCTIQDIHKWHIKRFGTGCGYGYFIPRDGEVVFKGRYDKFIGAHTLGYNKRSIGICLEGDFTKQKPSDSQIKLLKELITSLKNDYPTIKRVGLHREFQNTSCPVFDFKSVI